MSQELRSGELAKRAGVGVETLRFYERCGLIAKPGRTPSGYRQYPPDEVERVRFIRRARDLGFSLAEIRHFFELARDPGATVSTSVTRSTRSWTSCRRRSGSCSPSAARWSACEKNVRSAFRSKNAWF
jgi:DNA-binding transcriptional MerR regulator